jgi:upstream activation factor subunit UAF30
MPTAKKQEKPLEKKSNRKTKTKVEDQEPEAEVNDVENSTKARTRKVIDKESIMENFDMTIQSIENEIESLRENGGAKTKTGGIKFLRSINKQLKTLKGQSNRLMKTRKKNTERTNGQNSGFLKEVAISKELTAFTGWPEGSTASRVQVTKFICNYIKENDLQNPDDRREINPDKKLAKLLDLKQNSKEPLKYYSIQTHLKPHFK